MALPEVFSGVKHIQSVCLSVVNKMVKETFNDVRDDIDIDINISRHSLKVACLHTSRDSLILTVGRLLVYFIVVEAAKKLHPAMYAIPAQDYQEDVSFRPYVHFYFEQDYAAVPDGYSPIQSRLGFRLIHETSETINRVKLKHLADAIYREFGLNGIGYTFKKGATKCTYLDKKQGYDFRVNAISELEGELVIKKFLSIQADTYKPDCFTAHTPKKKSINVVTETRLVNGVRKKTKRWRPIGIVRFRYATCGIDGQSDNEMLVNLDTPYEGLAGRRIA